MIHLVGPYVVAALLVGLGAATTILLASLLLPLFFGARVDLDTATSLTPQIAQSIFGTWVWPFELLSVLLLVALIGAFAVSRLVLTRDEAPTMRVATHASVSADAAQPAGERR